MADLERAYGQTPASSTPGVSASAPPQIANPASGSEPLPLLPAFSTATPTPPPAVTSGHARRDAWGSWARQIRRLYRTQ
jgi:hypothetical protein